MTVVDQARSLGSHKSSLSSELSSSLTACSGRQVRGTADSPDNGPSLLLGSKFAFSVQGVVVGIGRAMAGKNHGICEVASTSPPHLINTRFSDMIHTGRGS